MRLLYLISILLLSAGSVLSQQADCTNSPPAGNSCIEAIEICDLNGYCGNTSSADYSPEFWGDETAGTGLAGAFYNSCPSPTIENNSFISFTANAATIELDVWVGNCTIDQGIQIMVFQPDGLCSGDVTTYYCNGMMSPAPNSQPISIAGLTPGEVYYLMVDGFGGDVCDYSFTTNSGIDIPVYIDPVTTTLCEGETITLTAEAGDGTYTWDPSPDLSTTSGASVLVTPPSAPGTYTYTVNSNGLTTCDDPTSAIATIIVESCGCSLTTSNSGSVCTGAAFDLEGSVSAGNMTDFSWSGPNGYTSSEQNPTGVISPTTAGSYDYTFTATVDGTVCTSTTTLIVDECTSNTCDIDAIRTALTDAGCIELVDCATECSMYFLNPQTMPAGVAQNFAEGLGVNLISIQSQEENDCIMTGLNDLGATGKIWIGLSDEITEGTFIWYDQSPVTYTNWAPGEPNQSGNEDCVQIYPNGMWNDEDCGSSNSMSVIEVNLCPVVDAGPDITMCEGDTRDMQSSPTILGSQPYTYEWDNGGPTTFANNISPSSTTEYVLSTEDRYECTGTDTVLVTVEEDCYGDCDVVAIRTALTDAGCIELEDCTTECSMYFLNPQTMPAGVAQNFAEGLGVNLISIQSQEENDCIMTGLNDLGATGKIWIGLSDEITEGTFIWYDQSPVTYTNWAPGEPNQSGNEDCVQIYPNGMWNDEDCGSNNSMSVIEVNLCPVVDAGPNITICDGETADLDPSVTILGSQPYTYEWENGPLTLANSVSPNSTTEYVLNTEDRYECTGTDTVEVNVKDLPVVDAGNDMEICVDEMLTLTGSGDGTWDNGVIDGVAFLPAATETYTYTVDTNGCAVSDEITVTVHPMPIVDAGTDITVCDGESVTLNGTGSGTWNNGVINGDAFVPTSTQTYIYSETINGCTSTDEVVVTVLPLPVVNISNDTSICQGESVILNSTGDSGTWNNGVVSGVEFVPTSTQTYSYTSTLNGCTVKKEMTVVVKPNPTVGVQPDVVLGCDTLTVQFTNSFLSPGVNYTIDFGDGSTDTYTNDVTHFYEESGCYDISSSAELDGCITLIDYPSMICVTELPIASFLPEPAIVSIVDAETTFINGSMNAMDYVWDFGDGSSLSTEYSPTHSFPDDDGGSYVVTLIANSGENCSDTVSAIFEVKAMELYYIPNSFTPDGDKHNPTFKPIFTAGYDVDNYTLYIFNRWGETVFESNNADYGWDGTYGGGSELAKEGMYVWKIEFKTSQSKERKIITGHVNLIR